MPGTPTTKYNIATLTGSDLVKNGPAALNGSLATIDGLLAPSDQGVFASRPVSTGGSPGKSGRTYMATDTGVLYRDNGTGWDTVLTGVGHAALLGLSTDGVVRSGKSIITATESRTNAAYGLMTTPDRVQNVVLPTDGRIFVLFDATWQASVGGAASAAIFLGATQTQIGHGGGTINKAVTIGSTAAVDTHLFTAAVGLVSGFQPGTPYSGVTTGQIMGEDVSPAGSASDAYGGAAAIISAAAGTYDVSVQFKASSGSVTAKNRSLLVWTKAF